MVLLSSRTTDTSLARLKNGKKVRTLMCPFSPKISNPSDHSALTLVVISNETKPPLSASRAVPCQV